MGILMKTKAVTLNRLVESLPPGVTDPTPFLYNESLYASAGLLVIGFSANRMIRAVKLKHFNLSPDGRQEDWSFVNADVNFDNVVDRDEANRFGIPDKLFDKLDTNHDGVISEGEFEASKKKRVSLVPLSGTILRNARFQRKK